MRIKGRVASKQLGLALCVAAAAAAMAPAAEAHTKHVASQHSLDFQPDEASDVFVGTVSSPAGTCVRNRSVTLFRKVGDASVAVDEATSDSNGIWSRGLGNAPEGRYYAKATRKVVKRPGHKHICDPARSNTVTVADPGSRSLSFRPR